MKNNSKNSYFFLLISLVFTVTLFGTFAFAKDDKTTEIDKIFSFAKPDTPGCAVAVSQNGKVVASRA